MAVQTIEQLVKLNRKDLLELQTNVAEAIKQSNKTARENALKKLEEVAREEGFSIAELYGTDNSRSGSKPASRGKGEPKFRHAENPEKTWTGKGRQPDWVKTHVENGGKLEDLAI